VNIHPIRHWPSCMPFGGSGAAEDSAAEIDAILGDNLRQGEETFAERDRLAKRLAACEEAVHRLEETSANGALPTAMAMQIVGPDLARLKDALRHRRMMEKSHAIAIDRLTARIHDCVLRLSRHAVGGTSCFPPNGGRGPATRTRWSDFVDSLGAATSPPDPTALVEQVMREAYVQTTEDLRFLAEQVKYFNTVKKHLRDYLQKLRDYRAACRSGTQMPHLDFATLRADLLHLNNAMRRRRMMGRSHAIGIDHLTRRIHTALSSPQRNKR